MLEYDFQNSVNYWIGLTAHGIERVVNSELAPHGITFRQVQVLACIALKEERSQIDLAEDLRIEPSTLVRVLDSMEKKELIERHPAPDDRRKKLIRAGTKVKPIWETIVGCGEGVRRQAIKGISTRELDSLKVTLEKIRRNLGIEEY